MGALKIPIYYVPGVFATVPCSIFSITLQNQKGCRLFFFFSPSTFAIIPPGPFIGNIFRDSFDVAGVDIVFEVCVFDAYSSLERMSCKWNVKIMTQNKKENNVGLLTEIYIRCGLAVSSRFWILWGQFCSDTVMHEILHLLRINSTNIMLLFFFAEQPFGYA